VVVSGKGGTGKTTVTGALAQLLEPVTIADCDVEAPNLHLLLSPRVERSFSLRVSRVAVIEPLKCNGCGACVENCRYKAIDSQVTFRVDSFKCEGCRVCELVCPNEAVKFFEPEGAELFIASTPYGPLVGAELAVGEEASGKVVTRVRMEAQLICHDNELPLLIIDGSPGTGCPVIASLTGADLALVVTEPTVSGKHDLERIIQVTEHFGIPSLLCLNKYDLNRDIALQIEEFCLARGLEVAAEIPFREEVVEALRLGLPPIGHVPEEVERPLRSLALKLRSLLKEEPGGNALT
jgi:MinD superfamily P-loop ATPase